MNNSFWMLLAREWFILNMIGSWLIIPPLPEGGGGILFYLRPSVLPSIKDIFRHIFLIKCWWQKSDIWSQASYRYTILWVAFLDPSDSYFLFAKERGYHRWALAHSSYCSICLCYVETNSTVFPSLQYYTSLNILVNFFLSFISVCWRNMVMHNMP